MLKFFASVQRHLAAGGELIFSIFVPSQKVLASSPKQRHVIQRFIDPANGKEVTLEEAINYDPSAQISHSMWYYSYPDQRDVFSHPLTVKSIFPQELTAIIRLANFKILQRYGDYAQSPFNAGSLHQIVSCQPI